MSSNLFIYYCDINFEKNSFYYYSFHIAFEPSGNLYIDKGYFLGASAEVRVSHAVKLSIHPR